MGGGGRDKKKVEEKENQSRRESIKKRKRSIKEVHWSNNFSRKRKWKRENYSQNNLI